MGKVIAWGEAGLMAANLPTSFSEINDDWVVSANADYVEIPGKLINADDGGLSASGNSIRIVNSENNSLVVKEE